MKPHEEKWSIRSTNLGPMVDATSTGESTVCMVYQPSTPGRSYDDGMMTAMERACLIAAAPEMARALLGLGRSNPLTGWHLLTCDDAPCVSECAEARAALRYAGVLP